MNISDVLGMKLGNGRKKLETAGMVVRNVSVTSPPRHKTEEFDDESRIIRIEALEDKYVDVLVSSKKTL